MYIRESIYVWAVGVRIFEICQTEKESEMNPRTNDTHIWIVMYTDTHHTYTHT